MTARHRAAPAPRRPWTWPERAALAACAVLAVAGTAAALAPQVPADPPRADVPMSQSSGHAEATRPAVRSYAPAPLPTIVPTDVTPWDPDAQTAPPATQDPPPAPEPQRPAPPAPEPVPSPPETQAAQPPAVGVIGLANAHRAQAGCGELAADPGLTAHAQQHSETQAAEQTMRHSDAPAGWHAWAENVAAGYDTPQAVVDAWMASDGHRANLLDCSLTAAGVGRAEGPGGPYWTLTLGAQP